MRYVVACKVYANLKAQSSAGSPGALPQRSKRIAMRVEYHTCLVRVVDVGMNGTSNERSCMSDYRVFLDDDSELSAALLPNGIPFCCVTSTVCLHRCAIGTNNRCNV